MGNLGGKPTGINKVIVQGGGGSCENTANPIKTGQTTSYTSGDDGDLQEGRLTDFTTLDWTNPFGNTNRFTDELGGQDYANDIVIDWSTFNQVTQTVLGWSRAIMSATGWVNQINACQSYSVGSYNSGWRMPNVREIFHLCDFAIGGSEWINYEPFNVPPSRILWTSTTRPNVTDQAYTMRANANVLSGVIKTLSYGTLPVRTFTWNGTTLT